MSMDSKRKWFDAKYPEVDQALASALFDVAEASLLLLGDPDGGTPRMHARLSAALDRMEEIIP